MRLTLIHLLDCPILPTWNRSATESWQKNGKEKCWMFQRNGKTRDTNGLGITDRGNNWVPTEREKEIKRERRKEKEKIEGLFQRNKNYRENEEKKEGLDRGKDTLRERERERDRERETDRQRERENRANCVHLYGVLAFNW